MKYIYVEHEDIEQFRKHMFVDTYVYQTSQGPLNAFRKSLVFDHATLFYRQESASLVATYSSSPEQFLIAIPLLDTMVNGRSITTEQLFVIGPNEVIHHPIPEGFQTFGVSFTMEQALRYLPVELLEAMSKGCESIRTHKIELAGIAEFKRKFIELYEDVFEQRHDITPEAVQGYEQQIFNLLQELFTPLLQQAKLDSYLNSSRRNIVTRAIEYIIENDLYDVPVQELADKCFCSMRSLEYAFKSIYQITPKQFLSVRRLHIVRDKIKLQVFASLKDLMSHMGVSNPGRFSAQYFRLFGEYPRETWSRHKSN